MTNDHQRTPSNWPCQALLGLLAEDPSSILWKTDTELNVTWHDGLGLDAELQDPREVMGKSLADFFHIKDGQSSIVGSHERALRGEPGNFEFRLAGEPFRGRVAPIQYGGEKISGCIGYGQKVAASAGADIELRRLFDVSLQMLCIASVDGFFKRINPAFEKVLGYSREELLARRFIDLVHPDDRNATIVELGKLVVGAPVTSFVTRFRTKHGSYRWLNWTSFPHRDGQLYGTATDVTELKSSQELCYNLLYHAPDPVIIVGGDGKVLRVNEMTLKVFGYAEDDIVGKPIEMFVPERFRGTHVRQRDEFNAKPHIRSMGAAGAELSAVRRDGTVFPAEISLGPVETDEGPIVICTIRDVTERKRTERALLEQHGELLAAEKIQERLRPQLDPVLPGFDISGACHSSVYAAGDLYDFFPMPGETTGIVVGDVTGHGISSALLMASTQAHIRAVANSGLEIEQIIERTNASIVGETDDELFVTLFLGRLDHKTGSFTYVNAGHPAGFVVDGSGGIKARLESTGIPIGIYPDMKFPVSGSVVLERGDTLVLPTDGILEAASPSDEEFGVDRLIQVVRDNRHRSAREIIESVLSSSLRFTQLDKFEDDATAVVVKCHRDAGDYRSSQK
jgi:PAS domain S-box-containing protein